MSEETQKTEAPEGAVDAVQAPEGAVAADNLNINDLILVRQIIATAQSRGAFRAEEMEAIGTVYNKLDGFLKKIEETAQAQQGPAEGAESTVEAPAPSTVEEKTEEAA